jgi:hypothetical protein
MPIEKPWYSIKPDTKVYHNNSECTEGNNIEPYNVERGTGGKRLCDHCLRLSQGGNYFSTLGGGLLGGGFFPKKPL